MFASIPISTTLYTDTFIEMLILIKFIYGKNFTKISLKTVIKIS